MVDEKKTRCVWITRPVGQADEICRLTEKLGLQVIRFPVIEIVPANRMESLQRMFGRVDSYAFVIFVSQNAVTYAFQDYLDRYQLPAQTTFVAIGKSTAATLGAEGVDNVLHADTVADSEALLALPALQAAHVAQKKILLVRGSGGRELLSATLQERGAVVDIAEVYLRRIPQYDKKACDQLWQQSSPNAIIVTSNEGIQNLVALTPVPYREELFAKTLVVMSQRNAEFARQLGFNSEIAVAKEKNDTGLVNALSELLETSHL